MPLEDTRKQAAPLNGHTSTCSFDQLSMLNDLTLDTCVPSFRCMVAHRMHKKMPNYRALIVSCRLGLCVDLPHGRCMVAMPDIVGLRESEDDVHSMMPRLAKNTVSLQHLGTIKRAEAHLGSSRHNRHRDCFRGRSEPDLGAPSRCAPAGAC